MVFFQGVDEFTSCNITLLKPHLIFTCMFLHSEPMSAFSWDPSFIMMSSPVRLPATPHVQENPIVDEVVNTQGADDNAL